MVFAGKNDREMIGLGRATSCFASKSFEVEIWCGWKGARMVCVVPCGSYTACHCN